jgi:hypothetical protein
MSRAMSAAADLDRTEGAARGPTKTLEKDCRR